MGLSPSCFATSHSITITENHVHKILFSLKKMVSNENWNTSRGVLDVVSPVKVSCKKSDGTMVELGVLGI